MRSWLAGLALIGLNACFQDFGPFDPKVGSPIADRCANQDSELGQEIHFSKDILPIFREMAGPVGCSCHQPSNPTPIGIEQTGLDLSSFVSLLAGGNNSRGTIVVPGQPCSSVLWQKLSAGPPFGARMPFNGPPFLNDGQRQLIADWIAEGARDN